MNTLQKIPQHQNGMSIIEIIVAVALFMVFASVGLSGVLGSFTSNRLQEDQAQAIAFAESGLEATSSLFNQGWTTPFLATNCSAGCGLALQSGEWVWSGTSNSQNGFERIIQVSTALRDGSGNIVESGGTPDPDTQQVTSTVNWQSSPTRSNSIQIVRYFTNFMQAISAPIGDWTNPSESGVNNLSGNDDALAVRVQDSYAYAVRSSGNPRFLVINISNPAAPTLEGSLALANANSRNLFVSGNYAYLVGSQNTNELRIIDISSPSTPVEVGAYNSSGNANGLGIYVVGSTAYMTTSSSGDPELYVLNVSNPASITLLGSLQLSGTQNRVVVSGNYAYLSSSDNAQEIQVVSISNPAAPSLVGSLNLPGNTDALSLSLIGTHLYTSQGSVLQSISLSNPTSPTLVGSLTLGGTINDLSLEAAGSEEYVFVGMSNNAAEFEVIDISDPTTPLNVGSVNISGNNPLRGVSYSDTHDSVVGASNSNTQEIIIFSPN